MVYNSVTNITSILDLGRRGVGAEKTSGKAEEGLDPEETIPCHMIGKPQS